MEITKINHTFSLPSRWLENTESLLQEIHPHLAKSTKKSLWIKELSDLYINHSSERPDIWNSPQFQVAYLLYFMPLNYLRQCYVINELKKTSVLDTIEEVVDFGSGCGTSQLAFSVNVKNDFPFQGIEINPAAVKLHQALCKNFNLPSPKVTSKINSTKGRNKLLFFSYSFNELDSIPENIFDFDHIAFVEPSNSIQSRKLMDFRQIALDKGYQAIAPCTHNMKCPLLTHSKKDWCHHTLNFDQPDWWKLTEKKLPIQNRSLSFTYLILSKVAKPNSTSWA
ncbi:MAG: hypothetical protein KDD50_07695, partial [Bdellovibrionales bacterium]|nr:hypothetical protein [Bdellovibrionales bacterium]